MRNHSQQLLLNTAHAMFGALTIPNTMQFEICLLIYFYTTISNLILKIFWNFVIVDLTPTFSLPSFVIVKGMGMQFGMLKCLVAAFVGRNVYTYKHFERAIEGVNKHSNAPG